MNHAVTFLVATLAFIGVAALVVGTLFYRIRDRKTKPRTHASKPGLRFSIEGRPHEIFRADLFRLNGQWELHGVPAGTTRATESQRPEVVVAQNLQLLCRDPDNDCSFHDSVGPVEIVAASDEFREHIEEWYPEHQPLVVGLSDLDF